MRLSWRLVLALVLLVVGTASLSFVATGQVVAPLRNAVFDAYVDQAVYIAEQVEGGADPHEVGHRMGLRVRLDDRPPPPPPPSRRHRRGHRGELRTMEREGREIRYLPGPRDHLHLRTESGWLHVHRGIDMQAPNERLGAWLLGVVALLGLVGVWAIQATLRPLSAATQAMQRVADGDLDHRIPDGGPPEVREVAAAFHTMTDRLKALLSADRQLLAGVSHELRTPLSRLRLRLELLRDELGGHERLDQMEADMGEIDRLVQELLDLSRLQLGSVPLDPSPRDLRQLLDEAVEASRLDPGRLTVAGHGPTLVVDPDLTRRAIGNLLQNVRRYAPEGPVEVRFTETSLTIADRGPGVPEDRLASLTEPFVRVDESRARHTGGLGLGLMIVRQVQELHGGTLLLANRDDGGFEATLCWPPSATDVRHLG